MEERGYVWNVCFVGKPENVALALENQSTKLEGQSKVEYDAALPHLLGLVRGNFAQPDSGYVLPVLKLEASGSGLARDGEQLQRSTLVSLQTFYGTPV